MEGGKSEILHYLWFSYLSVELLILHVLICYLLEYCIALPRQIPDSSLFAIPLYEIVNGLISELDLILQLIGDSVVVFALLLNISLKDLSLLMSGISRDLDSFESIEQWREYSFKRVGSTNKQNIR